LFRTLPHHLVPRGALSTPFSPSFKSRTIPLDIRPEQDVETYLLGKKDFLPSFRISVAVSPHACSLVKAFFMIYAFSIHKCCERMRFFYTCRPNTPDSSVGLSILLRCYASSFFPSVCEVRQPMASSAFSPSSLGLDFPAPPSCKGALSAYSLDLPASWRNPFLPLFSFFFYVGSNKCSHHLVTQTPTRLFRRLFRVLYYRLFSTHRVADLLTPHSTITGVPM